MSITVEMNDRIKAICWNNEIDDLDLLLYQICKDIYYGITLSKEQLMYICFIDLFQKYDIIVLMNLCK